MSAEHKKSLIRKNFVPHDRHFFTPGREGRYLILTPGDVSTKGIFGQHWVIPSKKRKKYWLSLPCTHFIYYIYLFNGSPGPATQAQISSVLENQPRARPLWKKNPCAIEHNLLSIVSLAVSLSTYGVRNPGLYCACEHNLPCFVNLEFSLCITGKSGIR